MNLILSIVAIVLLMRFYPATGTSVTFIWENGFRVLERISAETSTGEVFTLSLSPSKNSCTMQMSSDCVRSLAKVTITWSSVSKTWKIPEDRLPTESVADWSIRLN